MKYKKHILKQIEKQRNELVRKIAEVERLIADIPESDWKNYVKERIKYNRETLRL